VDREAFNKAGEQGFLCPWLPEEYGGVGVDFLYSVVHIEEVAGRGVTAFTSYVHNDIIVPYIWLYGTEDQKNRWLPKCASGEIITAIAMTEPDTGSDVQSIRTSAIRDGDHYVMNGQKTFITNGHLNDLVLVAAKTDPDAKPAHRGVSLFCVEAGTPGYVKGRRLEKIGWRAQDTAELHFEDCRVPAGNRIGDEGEGFVILMKKLQQERLVLTIACMAEIWRVLEMTKKYIKERKVFGRTVSRFQNTRFKMAEMYTVAEVGQAFLDRLVERHMAGDNVDVETAMAKWWVAENLKQITDQCLQLFGGYGYMEEYPIARAFRDARFQSIYGGASEIMKVIISRARL
jgi:acyl-CoA dehydrogenase